MTELRHNHSPTDMNTTPEQEQQIRSAVAGFNQLPELGDTASQYPDLDREFAQIESGRHRALDTDNDLSDLERALLSINGDSYEGRAVDYELNDEPISEEEIAKSGLKRFVEKFGLPEVASLVAAAGSAVVAHRYGGEAFFDSPTALAAYISETGAFYGTSLAMEWRKTYKEDESLGLRKSLGKAATSDAITYGAAEVVDLVTRNSALMVALNAIPTGIPGGVATQAVIAKLGSDGPFYLTANYFHKVQDDLKNEGVKPSVINVFGRTKQHALSFMKRDRHKQTEPDPTV